MNILNPSVSRPTTLCFILMCVTALSIIADRLMSNSRLRDDNPVVVLERPQKMLMKFGDDSTFVALNRGDSLKIKGLQRYSSNQAYLVETPAGDRGWLQADQLPIPVIISDGAHKGDTITLTGQKYIGANRYVHGYFAKLPDGTEIEVRAKNFIPALDGWQDMTFDDNLMTGIGTERRFESFKGLSLSEIEAKIGPAFEVYHLKDGGVMAQFWAKAFNGKNGKFYQPVYTFSPDGVATEVTFNYKSDRSDWLLAFLPGAGMIFDFPLTGALIRTSVYSLEYDPLNTTGVKYVLYYGAALLAMVFGVVWMFMTPSLIVLAMGWLVRFPKSFALLSDRALKITMLVVTVVCTYWWAVAMLGWGMFWPFLIIMVYVSRFSFTTASSILCTFPHLRCPHCHRLYTIEYSHDELYETQYKTGRDVRINRLLDTDYSKYRTYDLITTTHYHSDGRVTKSRSKANYKTHEIRFDTYEMIDYDVTYRVDFYHNHYVCDDCFYDEIINSQTCKEVDRRQSGTHIETRTKET